MFVCKKCYSKTKIAELKEEKEKEFEYLQSFPSSSVGPCELCKKLSICIED